MEHRDINPRHHNVLRKLSHLPKRMMSVHGKDNVSEFVLHDLCDTACFALEKAAYFVDNPDFNCFKGVAGYDHSNRYPHEDVYWQQCDDFSCHMQDCNFNRHVRTISRQSHIRNNVPNDAIAYEIARDLAFKNPAVYTWPLKHNNSGLFIYETAEDNQELDEHMKNGLELLGFCPIF